MDTPSIGRLLTRHFVRRFVDNDLLSAHADRHENLGLALAALAAASLFLTVLLVTKYILAFGRPGPIAVTALEDKFFLIALAMIVTALATVAQWDALSLDARDAAVLGPLPVRARQIVGAKAAAVSFYAGAVVLALSLAPSVLHPFGSTVKLRIGMLGNARLVAAHFAATVAATVFSFVAVLATRESLRLVFGPRLFARISGFVQALLVVALTTALLLLFGGAAGSAGALTAESAPRGLARVTLPALWFLGLAETATGDTVVGSWGAIDDDSTRYYRGRQARFSELARTGLMSLAFGIGLSAAAYTWNSRRLPSPVARRHAPRRLRNALALVAGQVVVRHPIARAGFFFTLSVLLRSAPHRLAMSVALAVSLALTAAVLGGTGLTPSSTSSSARLSIWALQTFVLIALAVGFRHAIALPAGLQANWIFHQCWSGGQRVYMSGVGRAALTAISLPSVAGLFPLHVYTLGVVAALFHTVTGLLIAHLLMAGVLFLHGRPPFLASYAARGNLKLAPLYVLAAAIGVFWLATLERAAASTVLGASLFVLGLMAPLGAVEAAGARRQYPAAIALDELPEPTTQTLGLAG